MKISPYGLMFLAFALAGRPGCAQIVARQGVADVNAPTDGNPPSGPNVIHFKSPMILEVPVSKRAVLERGTQFELPSLQRYWCDNDVSIDTVRIRKEESGPSDARIWEYSLEVLVNVGYSYDRRVDLQCRMKRGDVVVAEKKLENLKASEKRNSLFRFPLTAQAAKVLKASPDGAGMTLEITLTVRDDR